MKEIRSILFPTDFSAVANSVLPLAIRLASQFDAEILALHIASGTDPHVTETSRFEFPKPPADAPKVKITELIIPREGEPADMIMNTAKEKNCDLIVMASHGRSDVAQFFLGRSVAEKVARDSSIPTLIARLFGSRRTTRPIDRERGREILTNFFTEANALSLFGVVVRATGGVGESVVEEATAMQTDLIAIATSICCGGNPELTDTAEFIIRNAPCPVLCVNPCT